MLRKIIFASALLSSVTAHAYVPPPGGLVNLPQAVNALKLSQGVAISKGFAKYVIRLAPTAPAAAACSATGYCLAGAIALGATVAGVVYGINYFDPETQTARLVEASIASDTTQIIQNDDIESIPPATVYTNKTGEHYLSPSLANQTFNGYAFKTTDLTTQVTFPSTTHNNDTFFSVLSLLSNYYNFVPVDYPAANAASKTKLSGLISYSTTTNCPSGRCLNVYFASSCPAGQECTQLGSISSSGLRLYDIGSGNGYTRRALSIPLVTVDYFECPPFSSYSPVVNSCLRAKIPTNQLQPVDDNQCHISYTPSGCPLFNQADLDCKSLVRVGALVTSCPTNAAPSVRLFDPSTGGQVSVSRKNNPDTQGGGQVGDLSIGVSTPDPVSNTTKTETEIMTKPQPQPQVQPEPPKKSGAETKQTPGTTLDSPKAAPLQQVFVTNWPDMAPVINVQSPPVNVNVNTPDKIKIDSEGAAGEADFNTLHPPNEEMKFLDPLIERLNPFKNIEFPGAGATCPAVSINWTAFVNISANFDSHCQFLENQSLKTIVQSMIMILFGIYAIRIILDT